MKNGLKTTYKILLVSFGTLLGLSTLATKIAFENKDVINNSLGVKTTKYVPSSTASTTDTAYFKSKYTKLDDVIAAGRATGEKAEEEGAVLLKNANSALPLKTGSRKVSLVGVSSVDPVYGGTGSGAVKTDDAETMKDAFEAAGLSVNADLWNWYLTNKATYQRSSTKVGTGYFAPSILHTNDAPWADVQTAQGTTFASFGDAAILTLARIGGEGADMPSTGSGNTWQSDLNDNQDYLNLSTTEKGILAGLKAMKDAGTIKKIIVLINSANPMETQFIDDASYGIDAAMWIGSVGHKGLTAVGRLLAGDNSVTPSGCLSDTYFADNSYNPVLANFGDYTYDGFTNFFDAKTTSNFGKYVVYQEGIYLGYRYAETRYEDKVLGRANVGTFDYKAQIGYPFGYGLSYTDFSFSDFKVSKIDNDYKVSVKVTNTGKDYSGKQVVQIYAQKPYTQYDIDNKIEKSAVDLVGFAKTGVLAPSASQTVEVKVTGRDLASYDATKAKTYILDAGTYYLTAAKNSHEAVNNILAAKGKSTSDGMTESGSAGLTYSMNMDFNDTIYSYSAETNKKITNLFDHADINKADGTDNKVTYMTRNDWTNTYPAAAGVKLKMTQKIHDDMMSYYSIQGSDDKYPTYGAKNGLQLIDLMKDDKGNDIPYSSEQWDSLLDELSWDETLKLVTQGMRQTVAIDSIGKIATRDHNGPTGCTEAYGAGVNGLAYKNNSDPNKNKYPTCYPCNGIVAATFNVDLANEIGDAIGEDALWAGYSGLYGPCSNMHRSPYEGRCFEYYSEDAELSGLILSSETEAIQSHGCYVYDKHFALNDQETNRMGVSTWANEQTVRENYLKAFELTIREGNAKNVMTAMNNIGNVPAYADTNLLTSFLYGECGMQGFAVTDFYGSNDKSISGNTNMEKILLAGGALPDGNIVDADLAAFTSAYSTSGYGNLAQAMRTAAHRILYTVCHSNAMNGIAAGGKIVSVTPTWQTLIKTADIVFGVGLGVSAIMLVLGLTNIFPKEKTL